MEVPDVSPDLLHLEKRKKSESHVYTTAVYKVRQLAYQDTSEVESDVDGEDFAKKSINQ